MNILINASNIKVGGGLQVADSFIRELYVFAQHQFVVIVSPEIRSLISDLKSVNNVQITCYSIKIDIKHCFLKKDNFLDNIVKKENIQCVFSIFGPTIWKPNVVHICGFARPQQIYKESPFFRRLSLKNKVKYAILERIKQHYFKKTSNIFITENINISQRLKSILKNSTIYTVTNYYNQIFDYTEQWDKSINIPKFKGTTLLTISANYLHKNLIVIPKIVDYLQETYPEFQYRFVLTINEDEIKMSEENKKHILFLGQVNINQCPHLYEQCDFMFLPTLIECFSASYPEAMRMRKPILTSDLEFAHGLCGNAAKYFNPIDAKSIGDAIYELANNPKECQLLIENGEKQLRHYDNYHERAKKYIKIIENTEKDNATVNTRS